MSTNWDHSVDLLIAGSGGGAWWPDWPHSTPESSRW